MNPFEWVFVLEFGPVARHPLLQKNPGGTDLNMGREYSQNMGVQPKGVQGVQLKYPGGTAKIWVGGAAKIFPGVQPKYVVPGSGPGERRYVRRAGRGRTVGGGHQNRQQNYLTKLLKLPKWAHEVAPQK